MQYCICDFKENCRRPSLARGADLVRRYLRSTEPEQPNEFCIWYLIQTGMNFKKFNRTYFKEIEVFFSFIIAEGFVEIDCWCINSDARKIFPRFSFCESGNLYTLCCFTNKFSQIYRKIQRFSTTVWGNWRFWDLLTIHCGDIYLQVIVPSEKVLWNISVRGYRNHHAVYSCNCNCVISVLSV